MNKTELKLTSLAIFPNNWNASHKRKRSINFLHLVILSFHNCNFLLHRNLLKTSFFLLRVFHFFLSINNFSSSESEHINQRSSKKPENYNSWHCKILFTITKHVKLCISNISRSFFCNCANQSIFALAQSWRFQLVSWILLIFTFQSDFFRNFFLTLLFSKFIQVFTFYSVKLFHNRWKFH